MNIIFVLHSFPDDIMQKLKFVDDQAGHPWLAARGPEAQRPASKGSQPWLQWILRLEMRRRGCFGQCMFPGVGKQFFLKVGSCGKGDYYLFRVLPTTDNIKIYSNPVFLFMKTIIFVFIILNEANFVEKRFDSLNM